MHACTRTCLLVDMVTWLHRERVKTNIKNRTSRQTQASIGRIGPSAPHTWSYMCAQFTFTFSFTTCQHAQQTLVGQHGTCTTLWVATWSVPFRLYLFTCGFKCLQQSFTLHHITCGFCGFTGTACDAADESFTFTMMQTPLLPGGVGGPPLTQPFADALPSLFIPHSYVSRPLGCVLRELQAAVCRCSKCKCK